MTDQIDIYRYISSIRKRWPLCLTVFLSVLLLGVIFTFRTQKLYKASATLVIMPQAPQILTGVQEVNPAGTTGNFWAEEAFLQTEYQIMSGRQIMKRVYEKMNLKKDPRFSKSDPSTFARSYVTIAPAKKTRIVSIDVVHPDPQFSADLANTIVSVYLDYKIEKRHESSKDAEIWLLAQHEGLKKKLESSEKVLHAYMQKEGILNASFESQMETVKNRITLFVGRLAEVQAEQIARRVNAQALDQVSTNPKLLDSLPDIQKAPMVSHLKSKLMELKGQRLALSERYLPEYPKMKVLDNEISSLEEMLQEEIKNTLEMLDREQLSLVSTEQGLREAIAKEREQEAHLNQLSLDYGRLKREVDTQTKLYDLVTNRLKEISLTGMLVANNVSLMDAALVPTSPYKPDWSMNFTITFLLALFLGMGIALLLEMLDQTFKTQEQVEAFLKLPFLGVLPPIALSENALSLGTLEQLHQRDLFVADNPKSMVAECSRAIRTNLLFMSPDKPFKSLMVTSPMVKEGKTTIVISLSITMAQSGSRTILVDCDLRRPRVHKSFQLSNEIGISSVIVGETQLDQAIIHSSIPNLDLMLCGPIPPNPAELFHTAKFKDVCEELKKRYDKVIFDAPPAGAVTDPVILGAQVDGTLLVIKTGITHREAARKTVRALTDAHAHLFGVVLNDFNTEKAGYGYYYGKYYWYGRYYDGQYGDKQTA